MNETQYLETIEARYMDKFIQPNPLCTNVDARIARLTKYVAGMEDGEARDNQQAFLNSLIKNREKYLK